MLSSIKSILGIEIPENQIEENKDDNLSLDTTNNTPVLEQELPTTQIEENKDVNLSLDTTNNTPVLEQEPVLEQDLPITQIEENKDDNLSLYTIISTPDVLKSHSPKNRKMFELHIYRFFINEFGHYLTKDEINRLDTLDKLLEYFNRKSFELDKKQNDFLTVLRRMKLDYEYITKEEFNKFLLINDSSEFLEFIPTLLINITRELDCKKNSKIYNYYIDYYNEYKKIFKNYPEVISVLNKKRIKKINSCDYETMHNVYVDDSNTTDYYYFNEAFSSPILDEILGLIEDKEKELIDYEKKLIETNDNKFVFEIKKIEVHIKHLNILYKHLR